MTARSTHPQPFFDYSSVLPQPPAQPAGPLNATNERGEAYHDPTLQLHFGARRTSCGNTGYRPASLRNPAYYEAQAKNRCMPYSPPPVIKTSPPASSSWISMALRSPALGASPDPSVDWNNLRLGRALPKEEWKPDASAEICDVIGCLVTFSLLNRKHHCRACGKIFCGAHSAKQALLMPPTSGKSPLTTPGLLSSPADGFFSSTSFGSGFSSLSSGSGNGNEGFVDRLGRNHASMTRVCDSCYCVLTAAIPYKERRKKKDKSRNDSRRSSTDSADTNFPRTPDDGIAHRGRLPEGAFANMNDLKFTLPPIGERKRKPRKSKSPAQLSSNNSSTCDIAATVFQPALPADHVANLPPLPRRTTPPLVAKNRFQPQIWMNCGAIPASSQRPIRGGIYHSYDCDDEPGSPIGSSAPCTGTEWSTF